MAMQGKVLKADYGSGKEFRSPFLPVPSSCKFTWGADKGGFLFHKVVNSLRGGFRIIVTVAHVCEYTEARKINNGNRGTLTHKTINQRYLNAYPLATI
jgi:hypothetical protein